MTHAALHEWLASAAPVIRDHIVASTLLLIVMLAVSLLPSLRPRTRYALVFLGVVRFVVPGAVLAGLLGGLAIPVGALPPFTLTALGLSAGPQSPRSELLCVVAAVWAAGVAVAVVHRLAATVRWDRMLPRATAASAREIDTMRRIAGGSALGAVPLVARTTAPLPMTAGLIRPVVLLPQSCAGLDDDELTAVLAHELTHVERRHNLAAIVSDTATALFWFHPALWLAKNRLRVEAEKDCDERALAFVSDPRTYFSGMLKVCQGFIAPQPAGVSCMSTTQLNERMDHMMRHHRTNLRSVPHRLALAAAFAALLFTTMLASAAAGGKVSLNDEGVTLPKAVTRVDPVYPESARKARLEGVVVLAADIDAKGKVTAISVAQGIDGEEGEALEEAATAAVRQWTFEPARKDGKPVAVTFKITIRFRLDKKPDEGKSPGSTRGAES